MLGMGLRWAIELYQSCAKIAHAVHGGHFTPTVFAADGMGTDGSVRVLRPAGSPFTSLHHPPPCHRPTLRDTSGVPPPLHCMYTVSFIADLQF